MLSPKGTHIAALREVQGRRNAAVVDIKTRKTTIITNFRDADVQGLRWVNNDRLIFSLGDRERGSGDQFAAGLFVIDRDGSNFRTLVSRSAYTENRRELPAGSSLLSRILEKGEWSDDVLVVVPSMQAQGRFSSNVYRVNTKTGQSTLATLGGPSNAVSWLFDQQGVARIAITQLEGVSRFFYRDGEGTPWRSLLEVQPTEVTKAVTPVAFDAQGQLYVSAYGDQDTTAIYKFDTRAGRPEAEPVFGVKGFDVNGGMVFSVDGSKLLGIRYDADKPRTHWLDADMARIQRAVDQALPDTVNQLQPGPSPAEGPILINSFSDRDPGRAFLYDDKAKRMEQIATVRPWITPAAMGSTRFLTYKARDGLTIPANLTLPKDTGTKPPLVVMHYGGPWVRAIDWKWDPHVQFLVSRGYAVFMPAPRASTGFGAKLFRAGWKQWGLGMQDDVTDGVRAISERRPRRWFTGLHRRRELWRLLDDDGAREGAATLQMWRQLGRRDRSIVHDDRHLDRLQPG